MTKETKGVAVKEACNEMIGVDMFDLGDNMEGIEAHLPQIKILHQAEMFLFPDETKKPSFSGTIIDMNRTNAWWNKPYKSGSTDAPTCSSLNGITPEMSSEDIQSASGCANCPLNQFGSAPDGRKGKACRNTKRVHILIGDSMMPYRLTVSPANLKVVDLYVSLLTAQRKPYQLVETEFSLKGVSDTTSELIMKVVGPTPIVRVAEDAQKLKTLINQWRGIMRGETITGEEI